MLDSAVSDRMVVIEDFESEQAAVTSGVAHKSVIGSALCLPSLRLADMHCATLHHLQIADDAGTLIADLEKLKQCENS